MSKETIIVGQRRDDPFSRVSKALLDDPKLSWKAKGIAAYLLGKPSDWKIRVADIVRRGIDGEDAIRAGLKELRLSGYAKLECVREAGKVIEWILRIGEIRGAFKPQAEKTDLEKPEPKKPELEKPDSTKKEPVLRKKVTKKEASALPDALPPELMTEPFKAKWQEWLRWRAEEKKKKVTPTAALRQLAKLAKCGAAVAIAAIDQSIENDWVGLFPEKITPKQAAAVNVTGEKPKGQEDF